MEGHVPDYLYYMQQHGMSEQQARQRVEEDVFGVGFKRDRHGNPIERGIGSAAQLTEHHFKALERSEGLEAAERARRGE
jgi:hypothetical protein